MQHASRLAEGVAGYVEELGVVISFERQHYPKFAYTGNEVSARPKIPISRYFTKFLILFSLQKLNQ